MNFFTALIVAFVGAAVALPSGEKYETKYDSVDWKRILNNERLTKNYIDCILDKTTCSNDGAYLKSILPEALKTDCAKCSDKQKDAARNVIVTLYKKKPEWWTQVEAKFDPEHVYIKKYEKELKSTTA